MVIITEAPNTAVPLRRGGQQEEDSFFSSLFKAYGNSSHSPFSIFTKLAIILGIALALGSKNPADIAVTHLKTNKSDHSLINLIQTFVIRFLNFLAPRIEISLALALLFINWTFKPSIRNGLGALMIIVIFSFLPMWTVYEYAIICELYYAFIVIRNPQYKFLIIVAAFLFIIIDQDLVRTYFVKDPSRPTYTPSPSPRPTPASDATSGGVKGGVRAT